MIRPSCSLIAPTKSTGRLSYRKETDGNPSTQFRGKRQLTVAVIGGAVFWTYGASRLSERVVGGGLSSDVESRIELWSRAISMIEDFPFTGIGMNNFRRVMPVMYPVFSAVQPTATRTARWSQSRPSR